MSRRQERSWWSWVVAATLVVAVVAAIAVTVAIPLQDVPALRGETGDVPVRVSEFVASNTTFQDEDGDTPDWIEIQNRSTAVVDLDGWYLTDTSEDLTKWRLPGVSLDPSGSLVVFASGKDRRAADRRLHTNFRLEENGDYLALVRSDGTTIASDFSPTFSPQFSDASFGHDQKLYLPTPGAPNGTPFKGVCETPTASVPSRTFSREIRLKLGLPAKQGEVRYTLDGSEPTQDSKFYSSSIAIRKTTELKAKNFREGFLPSRTLSRGYVRTRSRQLDFSSNLPLIVLETFGRPVDRQQSFERTSGAVHSFPHARH